jgi:Mn-dependent DtxR family transcriptional regulator
VHGVQRAAQRDGAVLTLALADARDRVDDDTFLLKQEFLAVMLGVHRPTVTVVLRTLQREGLIASHYGRIRILKTKAPGSRQLRMLRRHS